MNTHPAVSNSRWIDRIDVDVRQQSSFPTGCTSVGVKIVGPALPAPRALARLSSFHVRLSGASAGCPRRARRDSAQARKFPIGRAPDLWDPTSVQTTSAELTQPLRVRHAQPGIVGAGAAARGAPQIEPSHTSQAADNRTMPCWLQWFFEDRGCGQFRFNSV